MHRAFVDERPTVSIEERSCTVQARALAGVLLYFAKAIWSGETGMRD